MGYSIVMLVHINKIFKSSPTHYLCKNNFNPVISSKLMWIQFVVWCLQQSEEEVLYQQELYEMLWLELQAWQAGLDSSTYDIQLVSQRHEVTYLAYGIIVAMWRMTSTFSDVCFSPSLLLFPLVLSSWLAHPISFWLLHFPGFLPNVRTLSVSPLTPLQYYISPLKFAFYFFPHFSQMLYLYVPAILIAVFFKQLISFFHTIWPYFSSASFSRKFSSSSFNFIKYNMWFPMVLSSTANGW